MPSLPPSPLTLPLSPRPGADRRLIDAIGRADPDGVVQALAEGANVNLRDPERQGQSPLMQSAIHTNPGHPVVDRIHDLLLAAGADVHQQDSKGQTVLMHAALFAQWDLCGKLLDAGARTEPCDVVMGTIPPIARALVDHRTPLVRRLLAAGGSIPTRWASAFMIEDVLAKSDQSKTGLDEAGMLDLVDLMITTAPVGPEALDQGLMASLHTVDHPAVVQRLLDLGAPMAPRPQLYTAFIENSEGTQMLLMTGWTVLHEAALNNRTHALQVLLAAGADPQQAAMHNGDTPITALDLARTNAHPVALSLMEQHLLRTESPAVPATSRASRPRL